MNADQTLEPGARLLRGRVLFVLTNAGELPSTFASNGTFSSNNTADILSTSVPASSATRRSGSYEIDGYVLRLKYTGGTSVVRSLVVSGSQLYISGDVYLPPS